MDGCSVQRRWFSHTHERPQFLSLGANAPESVSMNDREFVQLIRGTGRLSIDGYLKGWKVGKRSRSVALPYPYDRWKWEET